jgi:hypothetical protein
MTTDIDILILENYLMRKTAQDKTQKQWKSAYAID